MTSPHQPITALYPNDSAKHAYVRDLFNRGAAHYDRVGTVGFLGTGRHYRQQALRKAGLEPGMTVIDVACGTGAVTWAIRQIVGPEAKVLGVDPSEGMLAEARREVAAEYQVGRAENLPAPDAAFDFLSMGYALRHVEDLESTFREFHRVMKEGARLLILEISRPQSRLGLGMTKLYFRDLVPFLSRLATGSGDAKEMMDYYWETIEACVPPRDILQALEGAGFRDVGRGTSLGIFSEFRAVK